MARKKLSWPGATEAHVGLIETATLPVRIYVTQRHVRTISDPALTDGYLDPSAEKTSIGRTGVNITNGI